MIRKRLALLGLSTVLLLAGVACDDAPETNQKIDEDDRRPGPGDGVDEVGPFR